MKTKNIIIGLSAIVFIALTLIFVIPRKINIKINGTDQTIQTRSWTVEKALEKGGLTIHPEDIIIPAPDQHLLGVKSIQVEIAREVNISVSPSGESTSFTSAERNVDALIKKADLMITPNDKIYVNQKEVQSSVTLPYTGAYQIAIKKAVTISINDKGTTRSIQSSAETLGQAFTEASIVLGENDWINISVETILDRDLEVTIRRARLVSIQVKDQTLSVESAGLTVGEVLSDAGISLQGLDYSTPPDGETLAENATIQVIRVREEVIQTQTPIPFTNEYIQSDQVELDKTEIVEPGEFGLEVTRTRIRYENEQETSRSEEITWIAKQPITQKTGRGSQVMVRTLDTPQGQIEYWRTVNVYATSYSPCRSGTDTCYPGTSSGLPVQQGVVGVTRAWYNLMVGQRIYVPNYGIATIADVGGGIPGKYWIDLGYSDDDYVPWYFNVTIYFLTPVPDNIPWILP